MDSVMEVWNFTQSLDVHESHETPQHHPYPETLKYDRLTQDLLLRRMHGALVFLLFVQTHLITHRFRLGASLLVHFPDMYSRLVETSCDYSIGQCSGRASVHVPQMEREPLL
eukprot:TRINITY_DN14241_c0_g1_i5.p5 TRINITY_DN14241_c0_g1~~TRINITY_DN14241_c0_g1_i5.p5  ORF type:complete len:112 (-),score=0.49 TRINITY_DN14241_c0_g1_i5:680-1015(-)